MCRRNRTLIDCEIQNNSFPLQITQLVHIAFHAPEWIDFPREGNGWSCKYARRQWDLVDNKNLAYHYQMCIRDRPNEGGEEENPLG